MEVIYISSVCNPSNIEKIDQTALKKLEVSGIKFHNLLMKGFIENNVGVTSIIGLPISRATNKKIFWKKQIEKKQKIEYHQVGFINLPILKQLTTAIHILKAYIQYGRKKDNVYTIIDATYVSVIPFILLANKFLHIPTIGIVADIYDYMCDVDNNNGKNKKVSNWLRKKNQANYLKMDGFILLTEQMNEVINLNHKPYIVIEGCSDSNMRIENNIKKNEKRVILYSGKLAEKFGIKLLVEAYKKLQQTDIELWIYGDGEEKEYVVQQSEQDTSIKYKGFVSNQEVIKAQLAATLLVNPRPTSGQFTKYSFPSKNIEYMASGTPMLTTKLVGMPKEYYDYVFFIEEETVDGLYKVMNEILEKPIGDLKQKGLEAKEFILNNKNEKIQAKKITNFIKGVKR